MLPRSWLLLAVLVLTVAYNCFVIHWIYMDRLAWFQTERGRALDCQQPGGIYRYLTVWGYTIAVLCWFNLLGR